MADEPRSPSAAASSARQALAKPEGAAARTARLARNVLDPAAPAARRVELLNLMLATDPDRARDVALVVAADPDPRLSEVASHVLASTRGSMDDSDRLLELLARPGLDSYQRRNLSAALEGVRAPSAEDTIAALFAVLGVDAQPGELRADVLIPEVGRRSEFLALAARVRARAARPGEEDAFAEAAVQLCDQMIDLVVLAADGVDHPPEIDPDEIASIRFALAGRPDVDELLSRRRLRMRFPWFAACVVLREQLADSPQRAGETPDDRAKTLRGLLAEVVAGWARQMHQLHWAARTIKR